MDPHEPVTAAAAAPSAPVAVDRLQARTVRTLMASQVLGGIGVASGIAVAAIVAAEVSGRDGLSGLANTTQVLGAALITIPVAALMAARGRRAGLVLAYALGALGAVLAILAMGVSSFALLLLGTALFGAATTANNQARYAAADLAASHRKGRDLSLVVWATTVGSVVGPNLIGPGKVVAGWLGLPPLAGSWVFAGAGFLLALAWLSLRMRPDPLLTARELAARPAGDLAGAADPLAGPAATPAPSRGSVRSGLRALRSSPAALLGAVAMTGGHVVMVAVMVMTPVHMRHGHAEVEVIGFVISLHILGMFGLAPVSGYLTDRWGARAVVLLGVGLQLLACLLAGLSPAGWSVGLAAGLMLLGLGWSATMVAGSSLVSAALPLSSRAAGQGAADLVMGLSAAAAGALAGVVLATLGYALLCLLSAVAALALGAYALGRPALVSLSR
ncbi:MFS transporter [Ornithinicoccus halotolerans]|uniref:MFS transporter n=1 Tax=Ornithinicoccus halotolerans TaxID=1748220 RepID=UPI001E633A1F|nr:MFS transporter [Ornithinicoccus halotolerans]